MTDDRVPEHLLPIPGPERVALPAVQALRGGITFRPPTPAEAAAHAAWSSYVTRITDRLTADRHAAIEAACAVGHREGWDVHIYDPPEPLTGYRDPHRTDEHDLIRLRCIGVAFTPAEHGLPVLHFHPYTYGPDDDEDW